MKKALIFLLVATMLLSMAACGNNDTPAVTTPSQTTAGSTTAGSTTAGSTTAGSTTAPATTIDDIDLNDIVYLFMDMTDENLGLKYHNVLQVTPENAGFYLGAENFTGEFESAVGLEPRMMTNPFIMILFRLSDSADKAAFAASLEASANLQKWICVFPDRAVTRVSGNTVLFLMSKEDCIDPILNTFDQMCAPGFVAEDHIVNPLEGKTLQNIYDELYELFSQENYGFMNKDNVTTVTASTAYGLGGLDLTKVAESIYEEASFPETDEDDECAYTFAMFRVNEGMNAKEFAQEIAAKLDVSGLQGEYLDSVIAYSDEFVIVYAGTNHMSISVFSLGDTLGAEYRMQTLAK